MNLTDFEKSVQKSLFSSNDAAISRLGSMSEELKNLRKASKKGRVDSDVLNKLTTALIDLKKIVESPRPSNINLDLSQSKEAFVTNLRDIAFPESVKISNLDDLSKFFDDMVEAIKSSLTINVPEPQVTVNIPDLKTPEITFTPEVNLDLSPITEALEELRKDLKAPKSSKEISGLSKIMLDIKNLLSKKGSGSGQVFVSGGGGGGMSVDEYKLVSGTPKTGGQNKVTVAAAGTPVNVSTSNVACKYVYLCADVDAAIPVVVGFSNAVRATTNNKNGIILIPGNDPIMVETNDLKNLWVDAETNGGILCYAYSAL